MNKTPLFKIALLLVGIIVIPLVVLALLSYNLDDFSWISPNASHPEQEQAVSKARLAGAALAGWAYYWLGWSIFLALGLLLWAGLRSLWLQYRLATSPTAAATATRGSSWWWGTVRAFGGLLALASGAVLCTLLLPAGELPEGAGGVVGQIVAEQLTLFGDSERLIVATLAFIMGILISTGISWVGITQRPLWTGASGVVRPKARGAQLRSGGRPKRKVRNALKSTVGLLEAAGKLSTVPKAELTDQAKNLELALADYGIRSEVMEKHSGPLVTRFDLELEAKQRVANVIAVDKDVARKLKVSNLRIVENIAGTTYFGIEVPNAERQDVSLSQVVATPAFDDSEAAMPVALGVDIVGEPVVTDFAAMPHLIVAGATGSGKSVCVHAILVSLLLRNSAEDLRLVLIDPKGNELSAYAQLPHLVAPVITDTAQATDALAWCVQEMDKRYKLLSAAGARELTTYNNRLLARGEDGARPLPRILVVLEEFADLILSSGKGKEVEQQIVLIAQKARAAGIHLLLATQRPEVKIITGLIKANVPARIALRVVSQVDSSTILDVGGAQKLLGRGDMLYLLPGAQHPRRAHGAFVSEEEAARVVDFWKQAGAPDWLERLESFPAAELGDEEHLYEAAKYYVITSGRVSVSAVQKHFRIGSSRASQLVESLQNQKVISPPDERGRCRVLVRE